MGRKINAIKGGQKSAAHPTWVLMSQYRRAIIPGATYFFTLVTYRRRPILCNPLVRSVLRGAIKAVQSRHPFKLDAWVLLPDLKAGRVGNTFLPTFSMQ